VDVEVVDSLGNNTFTALLNLKLSDERFAT
jgi:hypothetical protein